MGIGAFNKHTDHSVCCAHNGQGGMTNVNTCWFRRRTTTKRFLFMFRSGIMATGVIQSSALANQPLLWTTSTSAFNVWGLRKKTPFIFLFQWPKNCFGSEKLPNDRRNTSAMCKIDSLVVTGGKTSLTHTQRSDSTIFADGILKS